jgi:thiol-disulfide isomerase/thioredoxin
MVLMKKMITSKLAMIPGAAVPIGDFSGITAEGKSFNLASEKGKYVIIDFWGTWCGACIYGFPKMKEYYAKYKDKIEFVSIDCNDSEENWRLGVKKYSLLWPQLFNGQGEKNWMRKYFISHFPTKILLDKEGKIINIYTGEADDLYLKLDELLNIHT